MMRRQPAEGSRQQYVRSAAGRRIAAHTPALRRSCRCKPCWARRWWTPARRAARSEQLRQQYADGRRTASRDVNRGRPSVWTTEQDDALRALVGRHDLGTIAQLISARFGYPRTEAAVQHRIVHLSLSRMARRPLTSTEVGRLFGVSRETVRQRFVRHGYLLGTLRRGGPHGIRLFERSEVERMVRDHPEAYDLDLIRDPALRALAIAAGRGRRLLGTAQVARLTGVDPRTLAGWCLAGRIPSARSVTGVRPGRGHAWLLEAGDVETVRQIAASRPERVRDRSEHRRCPLTGTYLPAGVVPSSALRCTIRTIDRAEAVARLVERIAV